MLYRVLCLLLLLSVFSSASAQDRKERRRMQQLADQYLFSTKIGTTSFNQTIPFDSTYGAIILPVTIGGKTFNFVFDTGAPTSVSDSAAKYLSLAQVFEGFGVHNPTGEVRKQPIYRISDLQLGDVHFNDVGCIVFNFDAISDAACMRLDGIIGANLMRSCFWKIDFNAGTCTLSSTLPTIPADATSLPFHQEFGGSPLVTANYGKVLFDAGWDSGNNGLFEVADSIFFKSSARHTTRTARGTGEVFKTIYGNNVSAVHRAVADSLWIGGNLFRKETISISTVVHPIIGTAFMRRHGYFILDWKKSKIYLGQRTGDYSRYHQTLGFNAGMEEGALKVVFLWDASPAAEAGLHVGDTITAINGRPVRGISAEDWCTLRGTIETAQQVSLEFASQGSGAVQTATISRGDLFVQ